MPLDRLAEDAEAGRRLFNEAWAANWGFVPVSQAEMASMVKAFRPLLRREWGVFVESRGELVGFALFLPNVFEITGDLGGAPSALGWLKLGWRVMRRDSMAEGASCSASPSRWSAPSPAPASPSSSSTSSGAGRRRPVCKISNAVGFLMTIMQ